MQVRGVGCFYSPAAKQADQRAPEAVAARIEG
jgi:hypothetical protein